MRDDLAVHAPRFETHLSELDYLRFRQLIAQRFGIDFPPKRRRALELRIGRRMRARGARRFTEYYRLLRYDTDAGGEWRHLADVVTNNETYFFREPLQFEQLATILTRRGRTGRPLRVLSAGCSTGEEAYSLALLLLRRGLAPAGFEVLGVDVSRACIDHAVAGRYPERSFRGPFPADIDRARYFDRDVAGMWSVRDRVRADVTFRVGNLVDPPELRPFDVVFCRNVLIYADPGQFPRFMSTLAELLVPGGHLFLGHSESLLGRQVPFGPRKVGDRFVYERLA